MRRIVPTSLMGLMVLQCLMLVKISSTLAITMPKETTSTPDMLSARGLGRSLTQCFGSAAKIKCFEMQIVNALEAALLDNSTWHYSEIISLEKRSDDNNATWYFTSPPQQQQRSLSDTISMKLLQLAQSRYIRVQLPGISGALDDLSGTVANQLDGVGGGADEGRKKKDKDKNMAMMGGMALLAMVAQMFLGKVILIAGAAFVMAKIALLVSLLGSLKSKTGGSSGSTEHVIVTNAGGGGGGGGGHTSSDSGWHRSMPYEVISDEHEPTEHVQPTGPVVSAGDLPPSHGGGGGGGPSHKPSYYEITEADDVGGFL